MQIRSFVTVILVSTLAPGLAFAAKEGGPKARLMAKYDANANGVIDGTEIAAVRAAFAAEPEGDLKRFDKNKDGKLDDTEITAIKAPGGKGKKSDADATKGDTAGKKHHKKSTSQDGN